MAGCNNVFKNSMWMTELTFQKILAEDPLIGKMSNTSNFALNMLVHGL